MARVVSFELSTQHPTEAIQFYSEVFGWKAGTPNWDYWPIDTGNEDLPGIHGGISRGPADHPHGVRLMLQVDSLDTVVEQAVQRGAQVVRAKMEFDEFWLAYLVDPVGVGLGLIQYK